MTIDPKLINLVNFKQMLVESFFFYLAFPFLFVIGLITFPLHGAATITSCDNSHNHCWIDDIPQWLLISGLLWSFIITGFGYLMKTSKRKKYEEEKLIRRQELEDEFDNNFRKNKDYLRQRYVKGLLEV